jgi:formylglycine-generating enzyme required for sulfatase activity
MGMGTPLTGPTASTTRQANGLGVKDVIGNVAEWGNLYFSDGGGMGGSQLTANALVYGGSYLGFMSADDPWSGGGGGTTQFTSSNGGMGGSTPESLFHLELTGLPTAKSPAVGFRCASYVWSN